MKCLHIIAIPMVFGCAGPQPPEQPVGLPNPASTYCAQQGGRLEIRKEADGERGYCHLSDGRVIEEWELYRSQPQ